MTSKPKPITPRQYELLCYVRDYQSMPERTRGIADRLHDLKLAQNMYTAYNVWLITDAGLDAIAAYEAVKS